MSKVSKFYSKLINVVDNVSTVDAKLIIGDSINNNRTLTVSQVIRFLSSGKVRGGKKLAKNLNNIYGELRPMIVNTRVNNRTDAVDFNEFINFYQGEILNGSSTAKRLVGSQLTL